MLIVYMYNESYYSMMKGVIDKFLFWCIYIFKNGKIEILIDFDKN